ncbi:mitochondrial amino-acid acetyltransferase [Tricladium varicosporioides]|nr:mitochondrial amino-acid acetyltransferase [Hymenoscyphus varicosporioides]
MILQNLASKKGKVAGHNIQSWAKRKRRSGISSQDGIFYYSTDRKSNKPLLEELAKEHVRDLANNQKAKKVARDIDKDFFMSILGSSATKREAKSYIQRFTPSKVSATPTKPISAVTEPKPQGLINGVNLGGFYAPTSVKASPKFVQNPSKEIIHVAGPELHVALVKIRAPQTLGDEILNGIGKTLSQLGRLGLISVVVVDCNETQDGQPIQGWRDFAIQQGNRIVSAIDANADAGARLIDNIIGLSEKSNKPQYGSRLQTNAHVTFRKLLMTPLRRGVIPVVPSVGYTDISQSTVPISACDTVLALAKELAGFPAETLPDEDPEGVKARLQSLRDEVSLDRLIILDPLGGIPTPDRPNGYHVFLNMEQEFEPAKENLVKKMHTPEGKNSLETKEREKGASDLEMRNPFSKFIEVEFPSPQVVGRIPDSPTPENLDSSKQESWNHLQNLQLARTVLSILPPSSSALLTTPEEAANSGRQAPFQAGGVGTRRHRNPLIHNLLTDKPVFSSSLPIGRLGRNKAATSMEPLPLNASITPTTFAKHGMPITIFPNPKLASWQPPVPGTPNLALTDSYIDLPRLVHLIEDSFGRKLDVKDYLDRVNGRMAGVIIAGEYEGGALLTWELPPGVVDDGSPESRARMVPYLDKFAVLKKSQGSGGVADAVFTSMVRDCFPNGVVWRSRSTNVVNKWYFERSRGTWKLPDAGWTMFWTTPDMDRQTFLDYEGVCRGIQPSWADNKSLLD